jgi:uncharacterized protein YbjT (DUF2867 family)
MAVKKIIAVLGATGAQGGGLVRAIHADPKSPFRARAITRNPDSDKAKALAALGAEVVKGDVDSADSLARNFEGAHGAFCVTFFWDHLSPEREYQEAGFMVEAAKKTRLSHVVWSTLEDTRKLIPLSDDRMPTLMQKYKVPHFDAKGEANDLFVKSGVPTTLYNTSFYWDNFIYFGAGPKPGPDGQLLLTLPMGDKKLPGIAAEDIGKCAYGVFQRGGEFIGKEIAVAGEHLSGTEMADKMSKALKRSVKYNPVPPAVYRSFGFPSADDLGNMFQYKHDFNDQFRKLRDPAFARSLNPALQNFDQWLAVNAGKIPLE